MDWARRGPDVEAVATTPIDGLFAATDLIPTERPSTDEVFSEIEPNYKALLNSLRS